MSRKTAGNGSGLGISDLMIAEILRTWEHGISKLWMALVQWFPACCTALLLELHIPVVISPCL